MFFLGYPFGIPMYSAVHLQKTESWQHNTAISATKVTKKKKIVGLGWKLHLLWLSKSDQS